MGDDEVEVALPPARLVPTPAQGDGGVVPSSQVLPARQSEIRLPYRRGPRPAFYASPPYKKMPGGVSNSDFNIFRRRSTQFGPGEYVRRGLSRGAGPNGRGGHGLR